jgi:formiminoglutamase
MSDPRVGEMIQRAESVDSIPNDADIVIIGFPHDEGVKRNGGRVGARLAPDNMRDIHLKRIGTLVNPELNIDCSMIKIFDVGNVCHSETDFNQAHESLRNTVKRVINHPGNPIPFVIGGGNDQSFSNAMGLLESSIVKDQARVAVINVDAHLDVREQKNNLEHSGSPFRLLLEQKGFNGKNFVEFAAQGTQCSLTHAKFVTEKHKGQIFWLSQLKGTHFTNVKEIFEKLLNNLSANCDHIFLSFDLDSVSMEHAPGVSCPSPIGLSAQEALDICYLAGKNSKVKLVDVSEYNPQEEGYRTGKLVANMFLYFVLGYTQREK